MAADPEILTLKEVCEMLGIQRHTLYKLIRRGRIPRFRVGYQWRFHRDSILRWAAENTGAVKKDGNPKRGDVDAKLRQMTMAERDRRR